MKKQSRTEVFTEIKGFANQFGFEVEYNAFECKIIDSTHTVNFIIWFDSDFSNYADGYVNVTYKVTASIATMGGNPTGDDLKKMASIIAAAGNLVNTLQLQQNYFESLTYIQYLSKAQEEVEEAKDDEADGYIESYKIMVNGSHSSKRRETEKGANSLADKLQAKGKHGTVEAVISKGEGVQFKLIRTF